MAATPPALRDDPAGTRVDPVSRGAAMLGLCLLFAALALRLGFTYGEYSSTIDEGRHVAASVELFHTKAFTIYYGSPPLPRYATGILPYRDGARMPLAEDEAALAPYIETTQGDREHAIGKYVLESRPGKYWRTLTLARIGNLVFLALLIGYAYRWASMLYGHLAGLVAATLISCSPNVIGHGALATVDIAFAATFAATAYHFWRWATQPRWLHCVLAATAFAAALLAKFPAPLFCGFVFLGTFALARWRTWLRPSRWSKAAVWTAIGRGAVFGAVVFTLCWATYQFSFQPAAERMAWLSNAIDHRTAEESWQRESLHWVAENVPIPMPELLDGLRFVFKEAGKRWNAFLLGETSTDGYWLYFPIAIGVKTTPAFLALVVAALGLLLVHHRRRWTAGSAYLLVGAGLYLLILMSKRMNIGVRHALPAYPMLAVIGAALFTCYGLGDRTRRIVRVLGTILLLAHVGESVLVHPNYLGYFNAIARGREAEFLLDSNLDWGQDLGALAQHCAEHEITDLTLSVFGTRFGTSPAAVGLDGARLLEPDQRPHGWFAVSANHLAGIGLAGPHYEQLDRFRWLEGHTPRARIGSSILLYELP